MLVLNPCNLASLSSKFKMHDTYTMRDIISRQVIRFLLKTTAKLLQFQAKSNKIEALSLNPAQRIFLQLMFCVLFFRSQKRGFQQKHRAAICYSAYSCAQLFLGIYMKNITQIGGHASDFSRKQGKFRRAERMKIRENIEHKHD